MLLVAAGLLLRSYANVLAVDPGFNPRNLLVAETVLPPSKYAPTDKRSAFFAAVATRVQALLGVTAAGFVNFPPLVFKGGRAFISAEGEPPPRPEEVSRNMAIDRAASAGYFRALGIPLLRGRDFDGRDAQSSVPVAIVNQKMADLRWPRQDPVGRRIKFGPSDAPGVCLTVVGVVRDVHEMAGYGEFADERRLTERQIATLRAWAESGAIEGDPAALPPAPTWTGQWALGEPDLVLRTPVYTLRAGGDDVYRNFVLPIETTQTRYVRAWLCVGEWPGPIRGLPLTSAGPRRREALMSPIVPADA